MTVYICEFPPDLKADYRLEHECAIRMLRAIYGPDFILRKAASGKPLPALFSGSAPGSESFFSISHCKKAVAVATDTDNNGVDMERRFPWKESLARRMCACPENEFLLKLSGEPKESWLQIIWSRKESYLKYTGEGLRRSPASFCVLGKKKTDPAQPDRVTIGNTRVIFWQQQTENYTLCTCGSSIPGRIVYLHFNEMMSPS